jgi:hypothetical protein
MASLLALAIAAWPLWLFLAACWALDWKMNGPRR